MSLQWDPRKEKANVEKHGVSFGEAAELFSSGADYLEIYDEDHSHDEDRFIAIGPVRGRVLVVIYTERPEDEIRLISARRATRRETLMYFEKMKDNRDAGT